MLQHDSRDFLCTLSFARGDEIRVDFALLDERVQHVEDRVRAPHLSGVRIGQESALLSVGAVGKLSAPNAEGLELIYELVDYIP